MVTKLLQRSKNTDQKQIPEEISREPSHKKGWSKAPIKTWTATKKIFRLLTGHLRAHLYRIGMCHLPDCICQNLDPKRLNTFYSHALSSLKKDINTGQTGKRSNRNYIANKNWQQQPPSSLVQYWMSETVQGRNAEKERIIGFKFMFISDSCFWHGFETWILNLDWFEWETQQFWKWLNRDEFIFIFIFRLTPRVIMLTRMALRGLWR